MKRNKIFRSLAFVIIMTTSACSLIKPKCQRLKLSEIFNVKYKNIVMVEYGEDGICRPTVAGLQEVINLRYENPNETYFWNYKQCKWITKSEDEQLINAALDSIKLPLKN